MSKWGIGAAILAALVGVYAYEKSIGKKKEAANPKARFEQGKAEGYAAGLADARAKRAPRVVIDAAKVDSLLKNPADWMYDPVKAYTTGYNIGYFNGYQAGIAGLGSSVFKKAEYCPTDADIDGITARIMLGSLSVEEAKAMDADLSSRSLGDPRGYCALPFSWAKVRMAIAEKSPGYVSPSATPAYTATPVATTPVATYAPPSSGDTSPPSETPPGETTTLGEFMFLRTPGSLLSEALTAIAAETGTADWLLGDPAYWKERSGDKTGAVINAFWRRGYKTAANQYAHMMWDGLPMGPYVDSSYPLPTVAGAGSASGPISRTGSSQSGQSRQGQWQANSNAFNARVSSEWRNQIPAWYSHPAFRMMSGR